MRTGTPTSTTARSWPRAELGLAAAARGGDPARGAGAPAAAKQAQPTNKRTFGSVFKNPQHDLERRRMLDACGLKGYRIGGAQISPKHANFIENVGRRRTRTPRADRRGSPCARAVRGRARARRWSCSATSRSPRWKTGTTCRRLAPRARTAPEPAGESPAGGQEGPQERRISRGADHRRIRGYRSSAGAPVAPAPSAAGRGRLRRRSRPRVSRCP